MKSNFKYSLIGCLGVLLLLTSCTDAIEIEDTSDLYIVSGHITDLSGDPIPLVTVDWYEIDSHHNTLLNTFTNFHISSYDTSDLITSGTTDEYGFIRLTVDKSAFDRGGIVINNGNDTFQAEYATQSIYFDDGDIMSGSLTLDTRLAEAVTLDIVNGSGKLDYWLTGDHQVDANGNALQVKHELSTNLTDSHNLMKGQSITLKYGSVDTTFVLDQSVNTIEIVK